MNGSNSIETKICRTNLTKFILNEISKIEIFFNQEIKQRKLNSKKLSKYVAAFDYIDKIFIVLYATSGRVSIISFTTVIGALVGIASASFTLIFPLTTGIIKILLIITRNKKKKHKILVLAKSKLNSIETLVSQALIDIEISHEEFIATLNEKDKYEKMKEDIRMIKSSDELNKGEGKRELKVKQIIISENSRNA